MKTCETCSEWERRGKFVGRAGFCADRRVGKMEPVLPALDSMCPAWNDDDADMHKHDACMPIKHSVMTGRNFGCVHHSSGENMP